MASKKPRLSLTTVNQAINKSVGETLEKIQDIDNSKKTEINEPRTFRRIAWDKLKPSPLNDYPIEDIEEMEDLLLTHGLLEPLNVHYVEDKDFYEIESGERRYTALGILFEKYENTNDIPDSDEYHLYIKNVHPLYLHGIYCQVESGPIDDDSVRERIIIHNETSREPDAARTASKLAELADMYERKNKTLPRGERLNVNRTIAEKLNGKYSERTIIRYKNFNKLIPELKETIIKYDMPISESSKYHTLSEEEQLLIAEAMKRSHEEGVEISLPTIQEVKELFDVNEESEKKEEINNFGIEEQKSSTEKQDEQDPAHPEPDADSSLDLEQIKKDTARKIIDAKAKKENRLKDTVQATLKKAMQLEKIYNSDETNPNSITDSIKRDLENILDIVNRIKSDLING